MVVEPQSLQSLSAEELRELTTRLMTQLRHQSALLDKLTHENALLKRMKFAAQSERFNPEQKSLLEDEIEADLAAVATEIDALQEAQAPAKLEEKKVPKRAPLPANLPRREIRHEPESTLCQCGCQMKRVGEDVAEKLDYVPGVFTVELRISGFLDIKFDTVDIVFGTSANELHRPPCLEPPRPTDCLKRLAIRRPPAILS
jgi:hypothetical protein